MKQYTCILLIIIFACFNSETLQDACTKKSCTGAGWDTNYKKKSITSRCGRDKIIGGYKVAGIGIWFQKKFILKPHNRVTLYITAFIIDAWDNQEFVVTVNGKKKINKTFDYIKSEKKICGKRYVRDKIVKFEETFKHTDTNLFLTVSSTLTKDPRKESFGFNTVKIVACQNKSGICGYNQQRIVEPCKETKCQNIVGWESNIQKYIVSTCGKQQMIGGQNVAGHGAYFKKTFKKLKTHNRVTIKLQAYMIDSWDNEHFIVKADGQVISNKKYQHDDKHKSAQQRCGRHWTDRQENLKESLFHKGNELTLEITSDLTQDSGDESFGFNNVEIITCNTNNEEHCDKKENFPVYIDLISQSPLCLLRKARSKKLDDACKCFECVNNGTGFYSKSRCKKVLKKTETTCKKNSYCHSDYKGCESLLPLPIFTKPGCINIYSECNYLGRKVIVCENISNLNIHPYKLKQIRSMQIPDDLDGPVRVFEKIGFEGTERQFTKTTRCIEDGIHASFGFVQTNSKIITKLVKNKKN